MENTKQLNSVAVKCELLAAILCTTPVWLIVVDEYLRLAMVSCSVNDALRRWRLPEAKIGQYIWEALPFINKLNTSKYYTDVFKSGGDKQTDCAWSVVTGKGRSFILYARCVTRPIVVGEDVRYVLTVAIDTTVQREQQDKIELLLTKKAREVSLDSLTLLTSTRRILLDSAHQLGLANAERSPWVEKKEMTTKEEF